MSPRYQGSVPPQALGPRQGCRTLSQTQLPPITGFPPSPALAVLTGTYLGAGASWGHGERGGLILGVLQRESWGEDGNSEMKQPLTPRPSPTELSSAPFSSLPLLPLVHSLLTWWLVSGPFLSVSAMRGKRRVVTSHPRSSPPHLPPAHPLPPCSLPTHLCALTGSPDLASRPPGA